MSWMRTRDARVYHDASEPFLSDQTLGADDYAWAGKKLQCSPSVVQAIAQIESLQKPFWKPDHPVIRIERHWWKKRAYEGARKRIDELDPLNGGPDDQDIRWENFEYLFGFDPDAAVGCTSFGAFQFMGFNHAACGFADPVSFLAGMRKGAGAQTAAFVRFVESSPALHRAIRSRAFVEIARHYNGPRYDRNQYDVKLRQAVRRFDAASAVA